MASFGQHARRIQERKPKRITWVCGLDPWLRSHTLEWIRQESGFPKETHERWWAPQDMDGFWASANQYSLDNEPRMLVLHDAHRVELWDPLFRWYEGIRELKNVFLVFESEHAKILTDLPHVALCRDRGDVISCGRVKPDDLFFWLSLKFPNLSAGVVNRIIEHSDIPRVAYQAARSLSLFPEVRSEHVDVVMEENQDATFVDALIRGHKDTALGMAPRVNARDVVPSLQARLDDMVELHRSIRTNTIPDVPEYVERKFRNYASDYTDSKVTARRRVLAVVDEATYRGNRIGAAEALVRLW